MINFINNLNNLGKTTSILSFGFSTLNTTIPHAKSKKALFEFTDFCFKSGNKQFITVGKYGGGWKNNKKQGSVTFSQSLLKKAL